LNSAFSFHMKKHFNSILILILIVGFPLGSYLYLKGGFNYRKDILDEVTAKGEFDDFLKNDYFNPKKGHTILFAKFENDDSDKINKLAKVLEQFDGNKSFKIVGLTEGINDDLESTFKNKFNATQGLLIQNLPQTILEKNSLNKEGWNAMLVDTSSQIRAYYNLSLMEDLNKMIEHVSTVLPRKVEKDIVLERDKEK